LVIGRSIYWHKYTVTTVFCEPFFGGKAWLKSTKNATGNAIDVYVQSFADAAMSRMPVPLKIPMLP
jgi:hypothetical protein